MRPLLPPGPEAQATLEVRRSAAPRFPLSELADLRVQLSDALRVVASQAIHRPNIPASCDTWLFQLVYQTNYIADGLRSSLRSNVWGRPTHCWRGVVRHPSITNRSQPSEELKTGTISILLSITCCNRHTLATTLGTALAL
jgi:hypothetical protein